MLYLHITTSDNESNINYEIDLILSFLQGLFKKVKLPGLKALKIQLIKKEGDLNSFRKPDKDVPIFFLSMYSSLVESLSSLSNEEKKIEILRVLKLALITMYEEMALAIDELLDIFFKIDAYNYEFTGQLNKSKKSIDRQSEAFIGFTIEPNQRDYYLVVKTKSNSQIIKIPLMKMNVDGWILSGFGIEHFLKDGDWIDNHTYRTFDRAKELFFNCDLLTRISEMNIQPKAEKDREWISNKFEIVTTSDEVLKQKLAKKFKR